MPEFTRVSGATFTKVDTLYSVYQTDAYVITPRSSSNGDNTAVNLSADDGTVEGAVEQLVREISPLMYFADSATNTIHVVVDNHHHDADSLTRRVGHVFGTDSTAVLANSMTFAATGNGPIQTGDVGSLKDNAAI